MEALANPCHVFPFVYPALAAGDDETETCHKAGCEFTLLSMEIGRRLYTHFAVNSRAGPFSTFAVSNRISLRSHGSKA